MTNQPDDREKDRSAESKSSARPVKMPLRDGRSATPGTSASSSGGPDDRGNNTADVKHTSVDTNAG